MTKNQIKIKLSEIKLKVNNYKLQPEVRALFDTLIFLFEILLLNTDFHLRDNRQQEIIFGLGCWVAVCVGY